MDSYIFTEELIIVKISMPYIFKKINAHFVHFILLSILLIFKSLFILESNSDRVLV